MNAWHIDRTPLKRYESSTQCIFSTKATIVQSNFPARLAANYMKEGYGHALWIARCKPGDWRSQDYASAVMCCDGNYNPEFSVYDRK